MKKTFPASEQALTIQRKQRTTKYPWATMEIKTAFKVEMDDMKLETLIPYASRMGRKLGRIFNVVDHSKTDNPGYEVAFIGYQDKIEKKSKPNKDQPASLIDVLKNKE